MKANLKARIADIDTTSYEAAHGHKPRGRGMWAFRIVHYGDDPREPLYKMVVAPEQMTYTEAKRWAVEVAEFVSPNARVVRVES